MNMKSVQIRKSNGEYVPFDENKVRESVKRTGTDAKTADAILAVVKTELKPRMSTAEIYNIVRRELSRLKPWAAARYNLREAITRLGPAGYNFETYVAAILNAYGYRAETPDYYRGACVQHEVDVTAEKEGRTAFIEAKFRHNFGDSIVIKDVLATWARFLDLVDGSKIGLCPHFDEAWVVTNARFTDQSLQYGHCKNMVLIGWNHPRERTFASMVDHEALYPLTILPGVTDKEIEQFARAGLMLCRELTEQSFGDIRAKTGMPDARLKEVYKLCEGVCHGDI